MNDFSGLCPAPEWLDEDPGDIPVAGPRHATSTREYIAPGLATDDTKRLMEDLLSNEGFLLVALPYWKQKRSDIVQLLCHGTGNADPLRDQLQMIDGYFEQLRGLREKAGLIVPLLDDPLEP